MKNLTLENITKACNGTYHGDPALLSREVSHVLTDSRQVGKDDLFVAIEGENVDAHKFIPDTIRQGALCVVSHEDPGDTEYPYILVESTGQALLDIAKFYRDSFDLKVIGITGSVGKTSTKEMIASVVSQKYKVHKNEGNYNNEWGLPLTIFGLDETHEVAILEMGVNHFGEMRRLSGVASPDICVITNIGIAHLEFFKTREGIFEEKSQMIQDMKPGGTILFNGDDDILCKSGPICGVSPQFFGTAGNSSFRATDIKSQGLLGTDCVIHLPDDSEFSCKVPLPGDFEVTNALAGAAVGYTLGLSPDEIRTGIENLPAIPGRNHIIATDKLVILDDCYNANPVSMEAAIDVLDLAIGRKVAILGNMGELGENESQMHYDTGVYAAEHGVDVVCGIGSLAGFLVDGAAKNPNTETHWYETTADFLADMENIIRDGDNVLVKASHAMHFPEIVEALQKLS